VVAITMIGYLFAGSVGAIDRVLGTDAAIALAVAGLLAAAAFEIRRRMREQTS
jgi:hypothetical protein